MATAHKKILIVEENKTIVKKLQLILHRLKYEVVASITHEDNVMQMAEHHSPDIVLVGLGVRGSIDGVEAAMIVHQELDIPVVCITPNSDPASLEQAYIAQPYGYIFQPFHDREIQTTIEIAILRHKADRELAESREWLATTLKSIGDGVIATDVNGNVKFMNPVAEELTGWRHHDAIGMPLTDVFKIINESTRKTVENPVEIVLREGRIIGLAKKTVLLSKDGSEYNIDDAAAPILDHKGTIKGVVFSFRDITKKKKAEATIATSERRYRALIENSTDMIFLMDADGKFLYASPATERILGYTTEAFIGKSVFEFIHPDEQATASERLSTVVDSPNIPTLFQRRFQHKNGDWLWTEGTATNLIHDPAVGAIVSNFRDITDRKNAVEQLQENYRLLQTITEGTQESIYAKDRSGKYLFVNSTCAKTVGKTTVEVIGQDDTALFPPSNAARIMEVDRTIFATAKPLFFEDTFLINGVQNTFMVSKYPLVDTSEAVIGVVGISKNITERKNAEIELSKSEEKYRLMFDHNPQPMWIYDTDTLEFLEVNDAAVKHYGYSQEEFHTMTIKDIHPNDEVIRLMKSLSKSVPEHNLSGEWRHLKKNGEIIYVEITSHVLLYGNRTARHILVNDITERKQAEEKLRIYERALQSAAEGIVITDAGLSDNSIIFANEGFYDITGYGPGEVLGKNCRFLQGENTDQELVLTIRKNISAKNYFEGEILNYKKDGTPFWNFMRIAPVPNEKGQVTHFIGFQNDVSKRKKAEAEIEASEAKYRSLIENSPDIIMVLDRNYDITFINNVIPGFTKEDVIGMNASNFVPTESQQLMKQTFEDVYDKKKTQSYDVEGPGPNGASAWYTTHVSPILSGEDVVGLTLVTRDITHRKNAEEELRKNEQNLRDIVEAITVPMVVTNRETGKVLYGNQLIADLLAVPMEVVLQQQALEYYHNPEDRATMISMIREHGFVQNQLIHVRRITGELIWVLLSARTIMFAQQPALAVTMYDISDQKNAEDKLRESEELFRSMIENSADGVTLIDSVGQLTYMSPNGEKIIGSTVDDLNTIGFLTFIHPDDRELVDEKFKRLLAGQEFLPTVIRWNYHYNQWKWVETRGSNLIDNPSVGAIVMNFRDVTEQQVAEEKLREQAGLLELVPDAIIVRNLDDTIAFWSKGAERMYGFSSAEAIGKFGPDLVGVGEVDTFYSARAILFSQGSWTGEFRQKTKDGKLILVQSRWKLVLSIANEPTAILVMNTDITERKSLEQQLFRAQRLESIGSLASGIAHDLNNILTPVILGMELIKLKLPDESSRKRIETIISTVKRGSDLIGQVLSFARGAQDERELINIKYIIDEVAKIARETFPREIDVTINLPTEALMVNANATQLHQILMNLCINARDAMNVKGGILTIEARYIVANELLINKYMDAKEGLYVLIAVRDTGIGIPHELQDKIFEPFYTTKEVGKGTGIGLTTVFTIVRNLGGFIGLYSEVNVGTAFSIYLPAEPAKTAEPAASSESNLIMGNGETILLVDDEDLIRNITEDILQTYGYNVLTANNGAEAIRIYIKNQDRINLIITDAMMPVMGGVELMGILLEMNPKICFIAASGVMGSDSAKTLYTAGAKAILLKPFTVEKLLNAIREVLE